MYTDQVTFYGPQEGGSYDAQDVFTPGKKHRAVLWAGGVCLQAAPRRVWSREAGTLVASDYDERAIFHPGTVEEARVAILAALDAGLAVDVVTPNGEGRLVEYRRLDNQALIRWNRTA